MGMTRPIPGPLAAALAASVCFSTTALAAPAVPAASAAADASSTSVGTGTLAALWLILAAVFVFWMQAGFSLFEAGFCRAKNVVNVLMKNLMDLSLGSVAYCTV